MPGDEFSGVSYVQNFMKKILQAAGLASASVALLSTPAIAQESGKWYTLKAGIRGFYDDNIYTAHKGSPSKVSSPGVEFTPGFQLNFPSEQTRLTLAYTYGLTCYADRDQPGVRNRSYDQSHRADLGLTHTFTPRYKISLFDQFAYSQEPDQFVTGGGGTFTSLARTKGNNVRNFAGVDFEAQLSRLWTMNVAYQNNYFNYTDDAYAAALNRMEHVPGLRVNYQLTPTTVVGGGYQYKISDYTANTLGAIIRDKNTHVLYGSVDHSFTGTLLGSVRGGVEITDYKAAGISDETNPYVDANLNWTYNPGSYVQGGVRHARAATDAIRFGANNILDSESTTIYAALSHAITGRLRGSLSGQYQFNDLKSVLNTASESDKYLILGATLSYKINQYLSTEIAYYFDQTKSDLGVSREFSRNRIFFGVRGTY